MVSSPLSFLMAQISAKLLTDVCNYIFQFDLPFVHNQFGFKVLIYHWAASLLMVMVHMSKLQACSGIYTLIIQKFNSDIFVAQRYNLQLLSTQWTSYWASSNFVTLNSKLFAIENKINFFLSPLSNETFAQSQWHSITFRKPTNNKNPKSP